MSPRGLGASVLFSLHFCFLYARARSLSLVYNRPHVDTIQLYQKWRKDCLESTEIYVAKLTLPPPPPTHKKD